MRDAVLVLPGFTAGTLTSLQVSLTFNLSVETSHRCSPTFTMVSELQKESSTILF